MGKRTFEKTAVIYIGILAAALIFCLIYIRYLFTRYYFIELEIDIFGDFRNMYKLLYFYRNPYNTGMRNNDVSYPPFALAIYMPFMVFFVFSFISDDAPYAVGMIFFILIPSAVIFLQYIKMLKSKSILTAAVMFTVFPFVFLLHRANVLIYCYMFVLLFMCNYQSSDTKKRELSLVALAAASAIKIYPLVFLALLFLKGRYKDILKTLLYFTALFFLPFLMFEGGFDNIGLFFRNMGYFTGSLLDYNRIKCDNYSFISLFQSLSYIFRGGIYPYFVYYAGKIVPPLFLVSVALFCLIIKSGWKVLFLLALSITLVPPVSYIYTQVFFIPSFISFINRTKKGRLDALYFILFLLILMPPLRLLMYYDNPDIGIPVNHPWYYNNPDAWFAEDWTPVENPLNAVIAVLSMALMYLIISFSATVKFIKTIKGSGFKAAVKTLIPSIK